MPFNAKGVFQRIFSWRDDRDAGIEIRANRMDQETDGIVKGLNDILQGGVNFQAPVKTVGGTAANPAFSFSEHATTGFFRKPDGSIGLSVNGAEVGAFSAEFFTGITDHYEAADNPHRVTAEQVGAIPATHSSNFVPVTRNIVAGEGLTGGGPLNGDVRLNIDRAFRIPELEEQLSKLKAELDESLEAARLDQSAAWDEVTGKPDTFPPAEHTHPIQQITGITISPDEPPSNVGENGDIWIQISE